MERCTGVMCEVAIAGLNCVHAANHGGTAPPRSSRATTAGICSLLRRLKISLAESVARFHALASPPRTPAGTATPGGTPVPVSPSEVEATAAGDVLLRCEDNDVELLCGQYTEYDGGCHGCVLPFGHDGPHDLGLGAKRQRHAPQRPGGGAPQPRAGGRPRAALAAPAPTPAAEVVCAGCSGGDEEAGNAILLCDGLLDDGTPCDAAWHQRCLAPPLAEVPSDRWLCDACAAAERRGVWRGRAHALDAGRSTAPSLGPCYQIDVDALPSPSRPTPSRESGFLVWRPTDATVAWSRAEARSFLEGLDALHTELRVPVPLELRPCRGGSPPASPASPASTPPTHAKKKRGAAG